MSANALTVLSPPDPLAYVRPTRRTLFWRTFLIWQLIRFIVINLRITVMIVKSHGTRIH